ncbi:disease resistance protein RPM1-like protein [Cinnamomum micranthum f. kanehirae]|uniref:Disease resistance protein RPM1-like protein n=1 Tax=Cinnamomum micranthum f. kanehirae TaxID=337451 RepID=A0A443P2D4_9MAGN|nr:disease resistance protein RPM1-like protein [Cinnamomum micranthum f. kanehirae]
MAESAVTFLLQTLGSLLQQEPSLVQGFRSSLDEIQLELQSMRSFLKDADRKIYSDDGVKTWVGQVREAAYKVEDIIDEYRYNVVANEDRGGVARLVLQHYYTRQTASELQAIKSKICEISERRKRYDFQIEQGSTSSQTKGDHEDGENWQRSAKRQRFIPNEDIVGIEKNRDFLIRRLMDKNPERVVISVVGMAGVGKTTLVTKAYDSPQVKNYFNCHALITVSQSYKFDELLRSLIKELYKSCSELIPYAALGKMSTSDLVEIVSDYLQKKKRYVIILDDVWESTIWEDILVAFPNNRCGGRIMITTRNENVISSSFGVENVLRLGPLHNEDAFILFCKKAFGNNDCPWELNPYAKRLVQKCEGLPLALVAVGRLMSRKEKSSLEWKKVEANLNWQLRNNKELERLKNILLLSFNDLPHNLKRCFLYCSLFPEDYTIPQKRLIRLWVAEGFIEEHGRLTLEEVAAEYIKELTCRSLLQIEADHQRIRICLRMHDVFRELALEIAREEKFCDAHVAKEEIQNNEARLLSLSNFIGSIQSSSCRLHSLMFFSTEIPSLSLNSMASSIKLLRVLDLQGSSIVSVPDELVELFNLRYLSLRKTNVDKLPESIGRFQNLQTLDIRDSKIKTLPKGVEKLKKLRHLYTYHYTNLGYFDFYDFAQAPTGICDLKCLQTLQCIGANNEIVKEVGNLTQLRKLTIRDVKSFHGEELCASLQKLKSLLTLQVKATREEEMLQLDNLLHPPIHLENLMLSGCLEKLPPWIRPLQDLTKVTLHWSRLNEDPFTFLQALPNLESIRLLYAYVGKELCIRRGSFLKLKSLTFSKLPRLERILIEEESMSCIINIYLIDCPELKSIPEGIQYLTSLQELWLWKMSGELLRRIRQDRGVNLQHLSETSRSLFGRDFKVLSMVLKKEDEVKARQMDL